VLSNTNFRWLLGGSVLSTLGDQFTLIALPWLVLQLSDDTLALGLVLAAMSLPRALFILVGGAVVDRHSPTRVLVAAKLAQCVMLLGLALALQAGALQMGMVYAVALGLGLATAFSYPAGSAMLPRCLPPAHLRPANSLLMSLSQLMALLGPVMAGTVIAHFHQAGLALSFGLDGITFAVSAATVMRLRLAPLPQTTAPSSTLVQDISAAARAFWADVPLRSVCLYFAAIACFVGGPISVALPLLARTQLPEGAKALGWLLAANGLGVLGGMLLSGFRPGWRWGNLGRTMLAIDTLAGLCFLPFGHITATWQGMLMLAPLGLLLGFVRVAVFSWMQKRVPPAMLGRTMSLFLFIIMGLAPVASAAAGAALRVMSLGTLFTLSGAVLLLIVALGACLTPIRHVSDAQTAVHPG
jgi:MFS family permease